MRTTRAFVRSPLATCLGLVTAGLLAAPAATARPERMVEITASVVEISRADVEKLGVDFSSTLAALQTAVVDPQAFVIPAGTGLSGRAPIDVWLEDGHQRGTATILSAPSVTATPGRSASFQIGGPVPAANGPSPGSFEIDLQVLSKIDPAGHVLLDMQVQKPTVDLSSSAPRFGSRTLTTSVRVPDGGSVVLRGLMPPDMARLRSGVPGLSQVPVLGRLFSSRSFESGRSDLFIFLTPRIVGEDGGGGGGTVTPQSAGNATTPAAPQSIFYGQVDYFGTQSEASRRPDFPLVTTKELVFIDNPATGRPFLGELSGLDTDVLYDDPRPTYGFASGLKGSLGGWLGRDSDWGVELRGFYVPKESTRDTLQSGQPNSFFSVPFYDQAKNTEYAVVIGSAIAGQPSSAGSVSVGSSLDLWGVGARARKRGCGCGDVDLGFSAGFRYLRLDETFQIDYATDPTVPAFFGNATLGSYLFAGGTLPGAGSRVWAQDRVSASNDFYGLELGLDAKVPVIPDLTLTISPSVALGVNRERLDTSGWGQAVTAGGGMLSTPYGVFARPGAVGSRSETRFAVVPEVDLQLSYQLTKNVELRFGYDFLFLSDMVWAGNQLSRSIHAPTDALGAFSSQPQGLSRPFETETFWAQSFRAGVNLRF